MWFSLLIFLVLSNRVHTYIIKFTTLIAWRKPLFNGLFLTVSKNSRVNTIRTSNANVYCSLFKGKFLVTKIFIKSYTQLVLNYICSLDKPIVYLQRNNRESDTKENRWETYIFCKNYISLFETIHLSWSNIISVVKLPFQVPLRNLKKQTRLFELIFIAIKKNKEKRWCSILILYLNYKTTDNRSTKTN